MNDDDPRQRNKRGLRRTVIVLVTVIVLIYAYTIFAPGFLPELVSWL